LATRSTDKPAAGAPPRPGASLAASGAAPALDPRLLSELAGPRWKQSWDLLPTLTTRPADPGARQRQWTLATMLQPYVRDAFALSERRTALDMRCGEGWLAQQLLSWGARRVVALDERAESLRRGRLLRDHFAIAATELELREELAPSPPGSGDRFDVVLLTGAPERAGDAETLTRAFDATASICAIECAGAEANAVAEAALEAGFGSVDRALPPLQGAPDYVVENRDLLIARIRIGR
jgi:predicted RNA methylase